MQSKNKNIRKLLEHYQEISTIGKINAVLEWDQNVNLPVKGADGRATQSAYLAKLLVEKWENPSFKGLLESIVSEDSKLSLTDQAIVRNLNQAGKYYWNVPKEVVIEFSETTSKAFMAWQYAKRDNKFNDFLSHLKKVVKLCQIIADHLGYQENKYDALLDLYEPGLTTKDCKRIFGILQPELTKLVTRIRESKDYSDESQLTNGTFSYPVNDQKQLSMFVLRKMNYDLEAGRLDASAHPFTDTLGRHDIRITSWYRDIDFRESLMAAMHESGHALYEQGVNEAYENTPLDGGVSLGIHESQSRFWENQIGRSYEFMKYMTPIFHAFFPEQLSKVGSEELFKLFNLVKPSLIRVEADEVTYNLHIALRFEIEEGLINGKLKVEDLPEIWRTKMKKYLGVTPEADREGVLQDIHWSNGSFGYFPTYTLGNLYAAQFTNRMKKEVNVSEFVEKGDLGTILSWLRTNIHQHGSMYLPDELCQKITGEQLNPKYFLNYLKDKYSKIYKI